MTDTQMQAQTHAMSKPARTRMLLLLAALLMTVAALLALGLPLRAQEGNGEEPNHAFIVVQDARGAIVREITFSEPISGLAALQASGLDVSIAETDFGPAVCAIEGVGCPADDCFCNPDEYWGYNFADGESWTGHATGAHQSLITTTGAIEGWRWGTVESTLVAPAAVTALRALDVLQMQQSAVNGGYGSAGSAVEVMLAIGANGMAASDWQPEDGAKSLEEYMRVRQGRYARTNAAGAGKLAVALAAADSCYALGTLTPAAWLDEETGVYSTDSGFNAWAILGSIAVSETVPASAPEALAANVMPDGGWEWQAGFGSDTNTTALALQALIATGTPVSATEIVNGLAFLKSAQQDDGGFAYDLAAEFGADANSTAYALQALAALGQNPSAPEWAVDGQTGQDYLLSLQLEDGSLEWQAGMGANLAATTQAVAALLERPFPLTVKAKELCQ